MAGKNVDNLKAFQGALSAFSRHVAPRQAALLHRRITLEALTRIVRRTPVDTGRARGNWQTSVGEPETSVVATVDRSGSGAIAKAMNVTENLPPFSRTWIANNLPYIEPLENGHSDQAPNGMVEVTFAELAAGLRGAALNPEADDVVTGSPT